MIMRILKIMMINNNDNNNDNDNDNENHNETNNEQQHIINMTIAPSARKSTEQHSFFLRSTWHSDGASTKNFG